MLREAIIEDEHPQYEDDWIGRYEIVGLTSVLQPNFRCQYKRLPVVVLNIKKSTDKLVSLFNNVKKQKIQTYDRIILFGWVGSNKGLCFAVIFTESAAAKFFFEDIKNSTYIGRAGYLLEPEFDGQFLTSDKKLPILLVTSKFYVDNLIIPNVNINPNIIGPGETAFFSYQHKHVDVETCKIVNACCTGVQCDRQSSMCSCFNVKSTAMNSLALSGNVYIDDHKTKFQSFSFMNMLVSINADHSADSFQGNTLIQMRSRIETIKNYVNANGGWTVIGWMRKGVVYDHSDLVDGKAVKQSEMIESDDVSPHIVRIEPTSNHAMMYVADIKFTVE